MTVSEAPGTPAGFQLLAVPKSPPAGLIQWNSFGGGIGPTVTLTSEITPFEIPVDFERASSLIVYRPGSRFPVLEKAIVFLSVFWCPSSTPLPVKATLAKPPVALKEPE